MKYKLAGTVNHVVVDIHNFHYRVIESNVTGYPIGEAGDIDDLELKWWVPIEQRMEYTQSQAKRMHDILRDMMSTDEEWGEWVYEMSGTIEELLAELEKGE